MSNLLNQYCATDAEIHDMLISGKQRLTDSVLHELSRDRGIFYSPKATREILVNSLSLLTFDYADIEGIIKRRDSNQRSEKTTSLAFDVELSIDEVKEVIQEYQAEVIKTEKVTFHQKGAGGVVMNIEYDEYDYSRTRLIQRQRKDAGITIVSENGVTIVRMPATEKSKNIVRNLREKIESKKKKQLNVEEVNHLGLSGADDRTSFFTSLIASIPGYSLQTVTNLKVASSSNEDENEAIDLNEGEDDSEDASAKAEMLAVVHSVAIHGKNLVASEHYQQLRAGGFFITAITWRSKQLQPPYDMVQFDASFEDGLAGTGFRYGVRHANRLMSGEYAKNFKAVDDPEKSILFELIETTARKTLFDLVKKNTLTEDMPLRATL